MAGLVLGLVLIVAVPLNVGSGFLLTLGVTIGVYAIAAVGLNLLTGYAGQISLAQSVFVGFGAYAGVIAGHLLELPLVLWLPATFLAGGLVAAIVAPLTLRLRGVYQIMLSLGLIFIGYYVFLNVPAVTGGNAGVSAAPSLSLGFLDFGQLELFGMAYTYHQGLFILVWLCLALSMIAVINMHRTAFGRSLIAVREAETAAQVVGINTKVVKINAFILAGAFGGLAGGLLLAQQRYVHPEQFELWMGLELLVIAVVGGLGATWGPVLGAAVIASIPVLATEYGAQLPFLRADFAQDGGFGLPVGQVGILLYGLALVIVVVVEPRGLAHWVSASRGWTVRRLRHTPSGSHAETEPVKART